MGNDQDVNAQFKTYKKDLASFKGTTKLVHYRDAIDSDHRGDDLSSEEDQLERQPAKYDCENSISIVWFVPAHLAPKILRAVDFYCRHHITGVEFNGVCIYQESKEYSKVRIDIDY